MTKNLHFRKLLILIALVTPAWAGIVEDVRTALAQNSFSAAEAQLNTYRASNGITPEYVEAYSWMGRAALSARDYHQAAAYAKQTKALALEQLKQRPLDAEPHLPLALGAAVEVESQTLAARGQRTQAIAVLADRPAHLWQYFDPRTPAEEPEPALLRRKTSARAEGGEILGLETSLAGPA